MTACSLLRLLLLRIRYLTTLGPKMQPSNISVKYYEENLDSGEVSEVGEYRIQMGRVHCSGSIVIFTCLLTHSEGQHVAYA